MKRFMVVAALVGGLLAPAAWGEEDRAALQEALGRRFRAMETEVLLMQHPKLTLEVIAAVLKQLDQEEARNGIAYSQRRAVSRFAIHAAIRAGFVKVADFRSLGYFPERR